MINNVVVFIGAKRDFNEYLDSHIKKDQKTIPFMELIQHYNARLRPNESGVQESELNKPIEVDNCICKADDYGSVLPHVIANFVNIICLNHNVDTLYIQNPPKKILESIEAYYGEQVTYAKTVYPEINVRILRSVYKKLNHNILGQEQCKKEIVSGLYRLTKQKKGKPTVIMLYGPSGVGKTETAKCVSDSLGGKLLRIQFSMMQNSEAIDYIFGAEHSKPSLARDLLGRETNAILIDEFDKVNPIFYNAFYELFDEGRYVDANYQVDMPNSIFMLTSNFLSENEIKKALGPAMFSRIGVCLQYKDLSDEQKQIIVERWYQELIGDLSKKEREVIDTSDIKSWFCAHVNRYDNIRILKNRMEQAIYDKLANVYIFSHM